MTIAAWALPCMGCTLIITCSTLFAPMRRWLRHHVPWLGELVICPMCTGFWVGFVATWLGHALPLEAPRLAVAFASGCASAFVCWCSHVALCAMGQGKLLSSRPDIP